MVKIIPNVTFDHCFDCIILYIGLSLAIIANILNGIIKVNDIETSSTSLENGIDILKKSNVYDAKRASIKHRIFLRTHWYQLFMFSINLISPCFNGLRIIFDFISRTVTALYTSNSKKINH